MNDYEEILTSDIVYQKYKSLIPNKNVSFDNIIQKLSHFYEISKDISVSGKKVLEHYNGVGHVYIIKPRIPEGLISVSALMYIDFAANKFQISGQSRKFVEKITIEISLLRGLTEEEHDSKELVFEYVNLINNYFN